LDEDRRDGGEWKTTKWTGSPLDVIWLEGLNHAEVFDTERDRKMVIDIALNYSAGESQDVEERPAGYGRWVEKSLLYRALPARVASTLGWDKTLEWAETTQGRTSARHAPGRRKRMWTD